MAQPITCDICEANYAVQLLTNMQDGTSLAMCPHCMPGFYGEAVLIAIGSEGHAGPPTKCQACRRTHERMTTPVAPIAAEPEPRMIEMEDKDGTIHETEAL